MPLCCQLAFWGHKMIYGSRKYDILVGSQWQWQPASGPSVAPGTSKSTQVIGRMLHVVQWHKCREGKDWAPRDQVEAKATGSS